MALTESAPIDTLSRIGPPKTRHFLTLTHPSPSESHRKPHITDTTDPAPGGYERTQWSVPIELPGQPDLSPPDAQVHVLKKIGGNDSVIFYNPSFGQRSGTEPVLYDIEALGKYFGTIVMVDLLGLSPPYPEPGTITKLGWDGLGQYEARAIEQAAEIVGVGTDDELTIATISAGAARGIHAAEFVTRPTHLIQFGEPTRDFATPGRIMRAMSWEALRGDLSAKAGNIRSFPGEGKYGDVFGEPVGLGASDKLFDLLHPLYNTNRALRRLAIEVANHFKFSPDQINDQNAVHVIEFVRLLARTGAKDTLMRLPKHVRNTKIMYMQDRLADAALLELVPHINEGDEDRLAVLAVAEAAHGTSRDRQLVADLAALACSNWRRGGVANIRRGDIVDFASGLMGSEGGLDKKTETSRVLAGVASIVHGLSWQLSQRREARELAGTLFPTGI